jgi:hypothetical protein
MALKYKYAKREEIPAEQAALYVEREGAFYLDAEGVTDKGKADEFRTNNVALKKELEEFKARFDGIDPEAVRQLGAEKARLEEEQRLKEGKFQEVLETRLKNAKGEWDKERKTLTEDRDTLTSRLTAIQIDQGVLTVATKRGLRPTAIPDITARARTVFKLVNGAPRAFEADGTTVRYGRDGVTPMTLEEWVDAQTSDAPHLFESNAGGGAAGNPAGGGTGSHRSVKNPFRKETWNLTEQMKLQKSDPGLAARLRAAA